MDAGLKLRDRVVTHLQARNIRDFYRGIDIDSLATELMRKPPPEADDNASRKWKADHIELKKQLQDGARPATGARQKAGPLFDLAERLPPPGAPENAARRIYFAFVDDPGAAKTVADGTTVPNYH